MSYKGRYELDDRFMRPLAPTAGTPSNSGPFGWTIKKTASSGTPTYLVNSSGFVITLAATSEAEIVSLYQNDVLPFLLSNIRRLEFTAKVSGIDAVTTLVMGLSNTENDAPDSVTGASIWFKMDGSNSTSNVVVESFDSVTNNDDIATGATLAAVTKHFVIDFSHGLSDIRFMIDGQPVAASTTFSMASASATQCVQLMFQIGKASGTGVAAVTIRDVAIYGIFQD